MSAIQVKEGRFIDCHDRHVLLHGINMVCKDASRGYIGEWDLSVFHKLYSWGFNVVRLGVIWDGVEPNPGQYDLQYLRRLRQVIQWAREAGLYVFLDMHQDLFSASFGDGAPAWATLTDGLAYEPYPLWSDAYLHNEAVQRAFDHFWNNSKATDGIGLQDHYAAAWRKVAEELGSEPNVIGYDLMNEPFMGSSVQQLIEPLMGQMNSLVAKRAGSESNAGLIADKLAAAWSQSEEKLELFRMLEDKDSFKAFLHALEPGQQAFEAHQLMKMYGRVAHAIREVDASGILFLETNLFANMGVHSGIEPILSANGKRDPQQAYAPHGYDLVTDTPHASAGSKARVSLLFDHHEHTRQRLSMPMLVGEWGAYYGSMDTQEAALHVKETFERLLCSDTYWSYDDAAVDQYPSFEGIKRGLPHAVAGVLLHYQYDAESCGFRMTWEEQPNEQPTLVYLPHMDKMEQSTIELTPHGTGCSLQVIDGSEAGFLSIPACCTGRRELVVRTRS